MWQRLRRAALRLPVLIAAGLFALYLLAGFFLVDPVARRVLPRLGESMLASKLTAQRVEFNPLTLELQVHGLELAEPEGALLARFDRLYVNLDVDGLARWAWRVRTIELQRPQARIEVRPGGALNWSRLAARVRETSGPPSDSIPRLLIDQLRLVEGDIRYTDADRAGEPFKAVFTPLGLELDGLSTLPEDRGDYLIAAKLPEQGGTLRWKGEIALNPIVSHGEVALEGARVGRLVRAVASPLAGEPSGTLDASFRYRFAMLRSPAKADVPSLEVSDARLKVGNFALASPAGGEPLLQVAEMQVADAAFDLMRREFAAGQVSLSGGKLAASRDARGTLDWQALLVPAAAGAGGQDAPAANGAPAAPWKLAVRDIRLADWSARWTDHTFASPLGAELAGFGMSGALDGEVGATTRLSVGPVEAAVGPLQLTSGGTPVAQLQRATLANGRVDFPARQVRVEAVKLAGLRTAVELDKEQRLNWAGFLRAAGEAPAAAPASAPGPLPDVRVGRFQLEDAEVRIVDHAPGTPVQLDVVQGTVAVQDLGLDLDRALPVEARFALKQGGRFEGKGSIVPGKAAGKLDVRLADLSLKPFAPYVNRFARLQLHSGAAGTRGRLVFGPAKGKTTLAYAGGFAVDDLAITEEDSGQPFLGWKKLSTEDFHLSLGPDGARIGELVAQSPFGRVIIFEDQTLNIQRVRRVDPERRVGAAVEETGFPLAVERLRIIGANAEFADLSLTPQFGTGMHELTGVVTGLSTDPKSVAQLELDGKVDEFGSARIRGSLQPFRATEFTEVTMAFRNLEMTRLTPYSGKFAGRKIESGRLSVDLEYKIKQRQLAGANKFVVNKLKLGDAVDSPGATKLPLDLAIALLEDSNGVIDLDLPVSGSLDDPQFSYGAIVWKAIVNVLTKLVTAPFRALAGMLGGNADKFESAGFDPGSSTLLPPEQEKLKVLAEALAKRPALKVTIEPGYDPQADRRALQEQAIRREAATVAGAKLAPDEAPGPVDVNQSRVQTWLEDTYAKRAGEAEYKQLRASFQDKDAGAVARVMDSQFVERMGRRFKSREDGPASPFHAELLERLTRQVTIEDKALVDLASARASAMREAVVKYGLEEGRVAVGQPAQRAAKDKQVGTGLALGARG